MSMRRILLLMLLALALPTAAVAQIVKTFGSGNFQSGTISGSITNGGSFDLSVVGDSKTTPFFSYDIGTLTQNPFGCLPTQECLTFTTGTVTIKNTASATVFTSSLTNGGVTLSFGGICAPDTCASLDGDLLPSAMVSGGSTNFNFLFMGNRLSVGSGEAIVNVTPEPSALEGLLLGTGLFGLVEMSRRRLKLVT